MTTEAIHLLPPPIDIALADHLPRCTANLMPLHIDYDGPAPVDSFLVQRSASSSSPSEGESFISAFRGRAIQSTPLPLPEGFRAKVVTVSQVGSATPSGSASVDGRADAEATAKKDAEALARERDTKRRRIANQPPAKQQRFSIDSDDDDDDGNDGDEEQFDDDYASISMQPSKTQRQHLQRSNRRQRAGRVTAQDRRSASRLSHRLPRISSPSGVPTDPSTRATIRFSGP